MRVSICAVIVVGAPHLLSIIRKDLRQVLHLEQNDAGFLKLRLDLCLDHARGRDRPPIPHLIAVERPMCAANQQDLVPPRERRAARRAHAEVALAAHDDELGRRRDERAEARPGRERVVLALVDDGLVGQRREGQGPSGGARIVGLAWGAGVADVNDERRLWAGTSVC